LLQRVKERTLYGSDIHSDTHSDTHSDIHSDNFLKISAPMVLMLNYSNPIHSICCLFTVF